MATQGILSVLVDNKVVAKLVTGADGFVIPKIAKEVKEKNIKTADGLYKLGAKYGLHGDSFIVQSSDTEFICINEDELPKLYAEKFNDPSFNPRWGNGTADFVEVVSFDNQLGG